MQKLSVELKNVPMDAPQVHCSTNLSLNRDQSLSVIDKVLANNSLDVDPGQHTGRSIKAFVYVLNKQGLPLMPCSYAKSKRMVKKGIVKIVRHQPFTIQLLFDCENKTQKVTLGIDTGAKTIGFSAISEKEELISGEVILDNKTKERLDDRRMYRRNKRNRLWYREPRFNNRSIPKGWLPPSVLRKYNTHLNIIFKLMALLPISKVIIETGQFDIQKINNPDVESTDYQQGDMYGYNNKKTYIMSRERYKCQLCGESIIGSKTNLHHIIPKSKGGTDKPNNLALLHDKCHDKLHKKNLGKTLKKNKQYKEATFMNIINKKFQQDINCDITFGYKTFIDRNKLKLEKTHYNDAFVIANGKEQERVVPREIIQKRRNNRCLQKNRNGFKPSIRRKRSIIQPKDLFWVDGKVYTCKGMFNKGLYILYGEMKKKEYFNMKKVEKYFNRGSLAWN